SSCERNPYKRKASSRTCVCTRSRVSAPAPGSFAKVEMGIVTSYPTPPTSRITWLGCFSTRVPRSSAIIGCRLYTRTTASRVDACTLQIVHGETALLRRSGSQRACGTGGRRRPSPHPRTARGGRTEIRNFGQLPRLARRDRDRAKKFGHVL